MRANKLKSFGRYLFLTDGLANAVVEGYLDSGEIRDEGYTREITLVKAGVVEGRLLAGEVKRLLREGGRAPKVTLSSRNGGVAHTVNVKELKRYVRKQNKA